MNTRSENRAPRKPTMPSQRHLRSSDNLTANAEFMASAPRFWSAAKVQSGGCLTRPGNKTVHGHTAFSAAWVTILAHRAAWIFSFGDIPKGKIIWHTCDRPDCVPEREVA